MTELRTKDNMAIADGVGLNASLKTTMVVGHGRGPWVSRRNDVADDRGLEAGMLLLEPAGI